MQWSKVPTRMHAGLRLNKFKAYMVLSSLMVNGLRIFILYCNRNLRNYDSIAKISDN